MGFALLFSGQGTQHPGMLRWVDGDDPILRRAEGLLGVEDWRQAIAVPGWATRNANAQVLLTAVGLSAWQRLAGELPAPAAVAGYSVGELAAFAVADVIDATDALDLAVRRAAAMDRCAALAPGGLLAVSGLPADQVAARCAGWGLDVAIRNAPAALVLGGPDAALRQAAADLQAAGARCVRLDVEVASHTPAMRAASDELAAALQRLPLRPPRLPLFSSTAGRIGSAAAAAAALAQQVSTTLRWDDCLDDLQARRVGCVLEVGPGSALASMWNQRFPEVPARSVDEFEHREAVVRWVAARA